MPTTVAGLSDDRIDQIIANHDANPANGDDSHTPREVVQMARELKARRALDGIDHAGRNRVAPFASATESLRTLANRGVIELPNTVLEMLEDCHRWVIEMGAAGPGEGP